MDGPCRAVWVQCNHVLPLGVLDVLGATDLKGPKVVNATLTYPVGVAEKCWESNVSDTFHVQKDWFFTLLHLLPVTICLE